MPAFSSEGPVATSGDRDALSGATRVHRRAFLASCGSLVLALAGCQTVLRTRFAHLALNDPHPDDYRPVLDALIRTILPFDDPRFPPITSETIRSRLLGLFPLEQESRLLVLQRGLMIFNDVELFALLQAPLVSEERTLLDAGAPPINGATLLDATIADRMAQDRLLYAEFSRSSLPSGPRPYVTLDPSQRAAYLRLWGHSGFNGKRLFYQAAKRLVMITTYSMEACWPTVGYAGPLLNGGT